MRFLVMALLLSAASVSLAGEEVRFYQVVGPDGRIQTVRVAPASKTQPAEKTPDVAPAAAPEQADASLVEEKKQHALKSAPYDGETYLDSDQLERSGFNPENRRKFFITSDGMRQRVEENLTPATADNPAEAPLAAPSVEARREHTELPPGFRELNPKDVPAFAGMCIDPALALSLADETSRLHEDKRTVYFSRGEPLVAAYLIKGDGLRTVQLRSYTDSIKAPAFFSPYIGMADDKGCLVRVLDSYFHRNYAMTKTQYEMLEAEITLHGEERYLLVLRAPQPGEPVQPELAYSTSPFGQISLKFLK